MTNKAKKNHNLTFKISINLPFQIRLPVFASNNLLLFPETLDTGVFSVA